MDTDADLDFATRRSRSRTSGEFRRPGPGAILNGIGPHQLLTASRRWSLSKANRGRPARR